MECVNLDLNISIRLHIYIENIVSLKTRFLYLTHIFHHTSDYQHSLSSTQICKSSSHYIWQRRTTSPELLFVGRLIPPTVSSPLPLCTLITTPPLRQTFIITNRGFRNNIIHTRPTAFFSYYTTYSDSIQFFI
jgi:hypothetical protein